MNSYWIFSGYSLKYFVNEHWLNFQWISIDLFSFNVQWLITFTQLPQWLIIEISMGFWNSASCPGADICQILRPWPTVCFCETQLCPGTLVFLNSLIYNLQLGIRYQTHFCLILCLHPFNFSHLIVPRKPPP